MLRSWVQVVHPPMFATSAQKLHNYAMNRVRVAVEWSYKDIKQSFVSQDFARELQVLKIPVPSLYIACALLRNFKTCLGHGAQPGKYFACVPPSLQRYIRIETNTT